MTKNNLVAPAGMIEENYHLYLTTVDGRVHSPEDIGHVVIAVNGGHPVQIQDVARVERGPEPAYTVVTAQGRNAVLLNIQSQPGGSTLDIAAALKAQMQKLKTELPPDMHLAFFYDQSLFVSDSVEQRLGRHHLRTHPVGVHPLFLPEKLGQRAGRPSSPFPSRC